MSTSPSEIEKLTNQMGGYRPETAHISGPGFPGWEWLPFVRRGWKWELLNRGRFVSVQAQTGDSTPIILLPGGEYTFPVLEVNQPQWIISLQFITSTPFAKLSFTLDEWKSSASHYEVNTFLGLEQMTNWVIRAAKPTYISQYGAIWDVYFDPVKPISVTSSVTIKASLPSNAPVPQAEIYLMSVGRVIVNDYNIFLDEVRKTAVELEVGQNIKMWSDAQSKDGKLIADIGPSGRRTL